MDPEPPQPHLLLALTLLPALLAAPFSVVGATVASLSPTRKAALRDNLTGADAAAIDRLLRHNEKLQTRWIVIRVGGVAATAAAMTHVLVGIMPYGWLISWVLAVACYAIPSEVLRQYARPRAESLLPTLLRAARIFEWIVAPIADPLYFLTTRIQQTSEVREPSSTLTESEVEMLVNEGELNGSLAHDQSEMIRNVLDFGEVTAEELMVPRTQMDALEANLTLKDALAEVTNSQHSRYPVYIDTTDNIVGILHVKDLFQALVHDEESKDARLIDLARKPVPFVAEGQLASTVLRDMRAGRHHMAVVLDEFGGVSGILTLEDLLEEIVGDIQDEHDSDDAARILMVSAHTARVDASTPVADINRALGTDLPEGDDYVSLGGLLVEMLGRVPRKGSVHEVMGLKVVVLESDARHIAQVELSEVPGVPRNPTNRPPASAA